MKKIIILIALVCTQVQAETIYSQDFSVDPGFVQGSGSGINSVENMYAATDPGNPLAPWVQPGQFFGGSQDTALSVSMMNGVLQTSGSHPGDRSKGISVLIDTSTFSAGAANVQFGISNITFPNGAAGFEESIHFNLYEGTGVSGSTNNYVLFDQSNNNSDGGNPHPSLNSNGTATDSIVLEDIAMTSNGIYFIDFALNEAGSAGDYLVLNWWFWSEDTEPISTDFPSFTMDNIVVEVPDVPPSNDAWFANLRANRVESDPSIVWRQFGPGMSGNNVRIHWHPTDSEVVFLGPNMGNAYRSEDKGTTYEALLDDDGRGYKFAERGPTEINAPDFSHTNPDLGFCSRDDKALFYKTTDMGKTWQHHTAIDAVWGGHTFGTIEADPTNEDIWYVGSGCLQSPGDLTFTASSPHGDGASSGHAAQICKSSDGGDSWTDITPIGIPSDAQIVNITVHPGNPSKVFAATTYGLYISTNSGNSWTAKTGTGMDRDIIRSFDSQYDPVSSNLTFYAVDVVHWAVVGNTVTNDGGGIFRSDDEGESWIRISAGLNIDVSALAPSNFTFRKEYFKALNAWFGISNADTTYTVYPASLQHSIQNVKVDPNNKNKIFALNDYKQQPTAMIGGMLWRTDDGGTNWMVSLRNGTAWEGVHSNYWANVKGTPIHQNIELRAQLEWEQRDAYEQKAGGSLEFNADSSMIMFQWAKVLCVSTDGGDSWVENDEIDATPGSRNYVGSGNSNLPGHGLRQDPRLPNQLFCPAGENDYWVTTTDGDNVRSGSQAARKYSLGDSEFSCTDIALHPDDTNTVYTLQYRQTHNGKLLISTNGGLDFAVQGTAVEWPDGYSSNDQISQVGFTIDPDNPSNMYFCVVKDALTLGYTGSTPPGPWGVRKSVDAGATWNWATNGLPESLNTAFIAMDPNNSSNLYACIYGTGGGLYSSTNQAASWYALPTFPSNVYSVSDLHFSADGKMYASCGLHNDTTWQDGGVWMSDDNGLTWSQIFKTHFTRMTQTALYDPDVILVQMNSKNLIDIVNPGTFLSKDGGATWTKINTGNPQSDRVNDIAIDQVQSNVYYASTWGAGWHRATLIDTNNTAPYFVSTPVVRSDSVPEVQYVDTIDGEAMDDDGDPIGYSLIFGPSWLSVDSDGSLTGAPSANALGQYICQVQADDGKGLSSRETLNFLVSTNSGAYYASWLRDYPGVAGLDGYTDDPDGDGLLNLEEYGLGGYPDIADSPAGILPTFGDHAGTLEYVYRRRTDAAKRGMSYQLETTTNLVSGIWTNAGTFVSGVSSVDADFDAVTNTVPTDANQKMIRLRLELQEAAP